MKHNFLKKLIAASVITSSVFSICPTTVFAASYGQWSKQGGNWYYYVGGQLKTGWIYDKAGWYYADKNGVMQTGVIQVGGKIYLLADSGVMQTGTVVINGKVYTAGSDGAFYGDDLPVPTKSFDWYGTNDNIAHPSQVIDSYEDDSSSEDAVIAYDPLAPKEEFQVIFKDEDGDDLKIRNVEDGTTITLYKPTKKGYEFVEWNTKKNGNGKDYDYDEEIKVEKDIKLYAIWDEVEVTDENAEELGVVRVEDITIVPEGKKKEITTDKGTLKFSVDVLPVNADNKKVDWSVESETGKATISNKGLLTAEENGVVIVKATAKDGSGVTDSMRITISGQTAGSGSGENGSGSGSGLGSGSGSGNTDVELPVIKGEEILVDNTTNTELMKGNTYSTIRVSTNGKKPVLQNIKANKLIINGGDHITLDNCEVNYIEVLRPGSNTILTLTNGSTAQIVNIERGVTLVGTGYNKVNVKTDEVVTIDSSTVVDTLNLTELKSKIKLDGKVSTMNIDSGATGSIIDGSGSIDKLVNDAINVKLSVSSVGSISGTVGVENTESIDLIKYAKELEEITKEVEAAEKANSTENSVLLAKIDAKIAANDPYKSEYEDLKFRIKQLEKGNKDAENLNNAVSYVSALEKAAKIDPTDTIKMNVYIEDDGSAKVTISGDGNSYNISGLREEAEKKVKELTIGSSNRDALENRINTVDATIKRGEKLQYMIDTITTNSAVDFTVDDYSTIGIIVDKEYVPMANKYVSLLHKKTDEDGKQVFKLISDVEISDEDISAIVTVLDKDKSLIKAQVDQATSIISTKQKLEEEINSFNDYIRINGLNTGKEVSIGVLESLKTKYESIDTKFNILNKEINDGNISEEDLALIGKSYDELRKLVGEDPQNPEYGCKYELTKYTLKFMSQKINNLYNSNVVNDKGEEINSIDSATISASLTNADIDDARKALNTIEGNETYSTIVKAEIRQTYEKAINKAQTQYDEIQAALEALKGGIQSCGISADKIGDNSYALTVPIPAASNSYNIDAENATVTATSGTLKFNVVETTGGAVELQMNTTIKSTNSQYTIVGEPLVIGGSYGKIGDLIITKTSSNEKNGEIKFKDLSYTTDFEIKYSKSLQTVCKCRVTIAGSPINSNEYTYTVTVTRI